MAAAAAAPAHARRVGDGEELVGARARLQRRASRRRHAVRRRRALPVGLPRVVVVLLDAAAVHDAEDGAGLPKLAYLPGW